MTPAGATLHLPLASSNPCCAEAWGLERKAPCAPRGAFFFWPLATAAYAVPEPSRVVTASVGNRGYDLGRGLLGG